MLNQVTKLNNGRIVLINGDCLTWLPQIRSKANMIFADLPYGSTKIDWDRVLPIAQLWPLLNSVSYNNAAMLFTAMLPFTILLGNSNIDNLRYDLVWHKNRVTNFFNARRMPLRQHENILVFYRELPTYNPQMEDRTPISAKRFSTPVNRYSTNLAATATIRGEDEVKQYDVKRYPSSVQKFNSLARGSKHPTQKPVELLEYLIKTYTNENDLVIDPTMGVGTTGVACAKLNRRFIGIELDTTEGYYNIAIDRIQEVLDANPT